MRLFIITPLFPPEIGGPATYLSELIPKLKERHEIAVYTLNETDARIEGVRITSVSFTSKIPVFKSTIKRLKILYLLITKQKEYDLIYIQASDFLGLAATFSGLLSGKPLVLRWAGDFAWESAFNSKKTEKFLEDFLASPEGGLKISFISRFQKFIFDKVDKVVVPSDYLKGILVKYYRVDPSKIAVIFNAVNPEEYSSIPKADIGGNPKICTVARLVPWKGIDLIIKAVPDLLKSYPGLTLYVLGDGPQRQELEMLSSKLGVRNAVRFTGILPRREVLGILKASDLFILNSRYEGLPHTVIEAMACGTPVIASNIRGTDEVIKDGTTGLLVDTDREDGIHDRVLYALENRDRMEVMKRNAFRMIQENFTWDRAAKEAEILFSKMAGSQ